jgi:hypothetical protein
MILMAIYRQWQLCDNIQRTNKKCEKQGTRRWDVMTQSDRQVQMLQRNLLSPPSGRTCTLKMEAAGSSETSVHIYNTTKCHISADSNVHSNYCENIKPRQEETYRPWCVWVWSCILKNERPWPTGAVVTW